MSYLVNGKEIKNMSILKGLWWTSKKDKQITREKEEHYLQEQDVIYIRDYLTSVLGGLRNYIDTHEVHCFQENQVVSRTHFSSTRNHDIFEELTDVIRKTDCERVRLNFKLIREEYPKTTVDFAISFKKGCAPLSSLCNHILLYQTKAELKTRLRELMKGK